MTEPLTPSVGTCVLHLFMKLTPNARRDQIEAAVAAATDPAPDEPGARDHVIPVAMLGHKADLAFMALASDMWRLRRLQTELVAAGLDLVDSYVSLTEISEYAQGVPDHLKMARLYPNLPPDGRNAWCFYPMSKGRKVGANWFTLPYEERMELMYEHGGSGRKFAGRVLQVITGSTGIDDYEWGVTLFAERPDDLKEVVYTMRYDQASALYGEFGPFYTGAVAPLGEVLDRVGLTT